MHELAVTQSVLEIALRHAHAAGATRIVRIQLATGELSSIVDDSVQFYWDLIAEGTIAQGALLAFRREPATLRCTACGAAFPLRTAPDFHCPTCGSPDVHAEGGDTLQVDHIEID